MVKAAKPSPSNNKTYLTGYLEKVLAGFSQSLRATQKPSPNDLKDLERLLSLFEKEEDFAGGLTLSRLNLARLLEALFLKSAQSRGVKPSKKSKPSSSSGIKSLEALPIYAASSTFLQDLLPSADSEAGGLELLVDLRTQAFIEYSILNGFDKNVLDIIFNDTKGLSLKFAKKMSVRKHKLFTAAGKSIEEIQEQFLWADLVELLCYEYLDQFLDEIVEDAPLTQQMLDDDQVGETTDYESATSAPTTRRGRAKLTRDGDNKNSPDSRPARKPSQKQKTKTGRKSSRVKSKATYSSETDTASTTSSQIVVPFATGANSSKVSHHGHEKPDSPMATGANTVHVARHRSLSPKRFSEVEDKPSFHSARDVDGDIDEGLFKPAASGLFEELLEDEFPPVTAKQLVALLSDYQALDMAHDGLRRKYNIAPDLREFPVAIKPAVSKAGSTGKDARQLVSDLKAAKEKRRTISFDPLPDIISRVDTHLYKASNSPSNTPISRHANSRHPPGFTPGHDRDHMTLDFPDDDDFDGRFEDENTSPAPSRKQRHIAESDDEDLEGDSKRVRLHHSGSQDRLASSPPAPVYTMGEHGERIYRPTPFNRGQRRPKCPWSAAETALLEEGMKKYGMRWAYIMKWANTEKTGFHESRTQVDLKDKARVEKNRRQREGLNFGVYGILPYN